LATRHGAKKRIADLSTGAMFAHYDGVPRLDGRSEGHIRIVVFEHGWIWFIPFLGGSTSVGAVVTSAWMRKRARASISDFFARTLARAEPARALIENATRTTDVQSVADFSYEVEPFVGDGWLCVGDACGFIDPLFSTGAHLAIKGADLAADAIDAALSAGDTSATAFAHYDQTIRYARELFLGVVQAFYRGEFRELLFWEDKRPTLHRIITSLLSGDVIFSDKPPTWARWAKQAYPVQVS